MLNAKLLVLRIEFSRLLIIAFKLALAAELVANAAYLDTLDRLHHNQIERKRIFTRFEHRYGGKWAHYKLTRRKFRAIGFASNRAHLPAHACIRYVMVAFRRLAPNYSTKPAISGLCDIPKRPAFVRRAMEKMSTFVLRQSTRHLHDVEKALVAQLLADLLVFIIGQIVELIIFIEVA